MKDEAPKGETLEQYSDRIVAKVRKSLLDRLPDDVIGRVSKSHIIFGKACAQAAVTTAMDEMAGHLAAEARSHDGEWETKFEVWQKDAFGPDCDGKVAGSCSLAEAQHYIAVYGQDGPTWIVEVRRQKVSAVPLFDEGRE